MYLQMNEGESKISIMLMLSITILAAVLVTGTVVSAAGSVNVQPNTNQHPVRGAGIPHIVSSTAHGSVNVQPNTNQHPLTKTLPGWRASPKGSSGYQCWVVRYYPTPPEGRPMPPIQANCPAKFANLYIRSTTADKFDYGGKLLGYVGPVELAQAGGWYGIDNAPIEIKVKIGKDGHSWYTPGVVAKTSLEDATFSGTFTLCDDPKYSDHSALFIAYLVGPPGQYQVTIPSTHNPPYPGPYNLPVSSGVPFTLNICHATQTKTNQHPVTGTGSLSTAVQGINVQKHHRPVTIP